MRSYNVYNRGNKQGGMQMTVKQIRAEVDAAKREAAKQYDRNAGPGAFAALAEYAKANNAAALDDICRVAK